MKRPRLGVFKLASCDGCQLTLLDLEDELLAIAGAVDIVHFTELTSASDPLGPFDVVLIEGSVSTPEQHELVSAVRSRTRMLVSIGACATAGGIQALRNFADHDSYLRMVYARPEYIASLRDSTPVSAYVKVDYELRGCPIDRHQLRELISALLAGRRPNVPVRTVCMHCKEAGRVCVMVARGIPCLGPVTHDGCGSLCPGYARGCYGCFGPGPEPNTRSLAHRFKVLGQREPELLRAFRFINGWAPPFRDESERHEP
jgi:coenzyme F420-reducing hydrogenase gamma subunit